VSTWRRSSSPSIRSRLAWSLVAWAVAWGLAVGAAVWLVAKNEVEELLDDTLRSSAELFAAIVVQAPSFSAEGQPTLVTSPSAMPADPDADERFAWQLVAQDGTLLMRSTAAPPIPWHSTATSGFTQDPQWRIYGMALAAEGRMLYAGQTMAERHEASLEVALSAALAALAVGLIGHVWLRSRIGSELRPLIALSDRLERFTLDDPDAGLDGLAPGRAERAELQPIHDALETLAGRLAARIASERAFAQHAAHALRTPLAGIDAQLAVALRESPPGLADRLQRVRDAGRRLQGVVSALLGLFRAGVQPNRSSVDVQQLVAHLPAAGLDIRVSGAACIDGDADLVAAALVNLLDNAQRHGASTLWLEVAGPRLLRLCDDGPGIDARRRAALQQSIDDGTYRGMSGLGLMLCDRVARAHGGHLRLLEAAAGFALEIDLGDRNDGNPTGADAVHATVATAPDQPQGPGKASPM